MASTVGAQNWVAIVDDDESIRRALGRLLRSHGIDAKGFNSARDYLRHGFDAPVCICLDLHLRDDMNGLDLSDYLHAQGISVPIILMTAQEQPELGPFVMHSHVAAILRKPLDVQQLLDRVAEYARDA